VENKVNLPVWHKTFDAVSDIVWLLDKEQRILCANTATESVLGRPPKDIIGLHCYEIAHPDKQPAAGCPLKLARKSMRREKMELMMGEKYVEFIVDPIADEAGRFNGAVHIMTDITERKRTQAEILKLLSRLAEKEKEIEEYLYTAAHDLRTPLICVQGFTANLKKDFKELAHLASSAATAEEISAATLRFTSGPAAESLDSVEEAARKIGQLLTSLLKVSRLGRLHMQPEILDTGAIVNNILTALSYQVKAAGAEITTGPLPHCKADKTALGHIFSNLLDNALKYRDCGRKLKITVRGEKNGNGAVVYSITDNGLGIKKNNLPKIWQVFYSGETSVPEKGEGIGLTMARRLADMNEGKLWAESKEGEGSAFYLELPAY